MRNISIRGFKSIFDEQNIRLAAITLLSGANSSGKSSALQPLLLMKQTIESQYDPGILLLDGANAKFTSIDQILSKRSGADPVDDFAVRFGDDKGWSLEASFKRRSEGGVASSGAILRTAQGFELKYWDGWTGDYRQYAEKLDVDRQFRPLVEQFLKQDKSRVRLSGKVARCFPDIMLEIAFGESNAPSLYPVQVLPYLTEVRRVLSNLIHIRGLRGNPERSYRATAKSKRGFPGAFEDYVASVLLEWQSEHDNRLNEIGNDLRDLGLSWKISPKRIEDTQVEIRVGRLEVPAQGGAKDLVSLADVGLGVSQILPLLVALRVAKKGQIVLVEQPEIHLHPRAQYALGEIVVKAVKRGIQIIIETHSSVLLRALQTQVAKKVLKQDQLALNWFTRDPNTGATKVTAAEPDELGRYGEWPVDFEDVSLEADRVYLDSVSERLG